MTLGRKIYLLVIDFVCTLQLLFYFFLLYLDNIPYTKNVYFHICTSCWHISQKSSNYFFPLRYPIICDTLYLGGILTSICTWFGHSSASIISTPFWSHNFLRIFPMSTLISLYIRRSQRGKDSKA